MWSRRVGIAMLVAVPAVFVAGGILLENVAAFDRLRFAIQRTPVSLPSSIVVPDEEFAIGAPLLSVYADPGRLNDPAEGLLASSLEQEIPATVSYFDGGRLVFASGVGLRWHGNGRGTNPRDHSFRLHFRREYSGEQFMPGVLFDGLSDPITRVVVDRDRRRDGAGRWWHLVAPLAYDIARQFGAETPNTHPVRFFLNGEPLGLYVLTDHLRAPFLRVRYGHDNFIRADEEMQAAVRRAIDDLSPLTMEAAGRIVDIESLTRWFIAAVFSDTANPFQAELFRDETQPGTKWFWVTWDLDRSFMGWDEQTTDPWFHDTFAAILHQPALQSEIVTRLIAEAPAYREYLVRTVVEALNHRVTTEFLRERLAHYQALTSEYRLEELEYLDQLQWFLVLRPPEVRAMLTRHLDAGEAFRVRVELPEGIEVDVDGYRKSGDFYGWYFNETEVALALASRRTGFSHWLVDGVPVHTNDLRHVVESDTTIRAVFDPND